MAISDRIFNVLRRFKLVGGGIDEFELPPSRKIDLSESSQTAFEKQFYAHQGRVVHKWIHYLPAYDRYFSRFVGTDFKMLEIGVFKGGSLEIWRNYFGPQATIFGVDIDPQCAGYVSAPNQVRIGSQADAAFLRDVVQEMGGLDVVLDDGSHVASHQRASFDALFPLLSDCGLYVIEDTHTSYWRGFLQGGYRRAGTAIELAKRLIDDMHGNYHGKPELPANASRWIPAIHIYDSMVFIEKRRRDSPGHIKVGALEMSG